MCAVLSCGFPLPTKKCSFFCILPCFPGLELPIGPKINGQAGMGVGGGGWVGASPRPHPQQKMPRSPKKKPVPGHALRHPRKDNASLVSKFIVGTLTAMAHYSRRVHG